VQLKNVEDENLSRGDVLCNLDSFPQICQEFEASISVLELPEHKLIMSSGYSCVIHLHAALEDVIISEIRAEVDRKTKEKKKSAFLKTNMTGIVRITTKKIPFVVRNMTLCLN